MNSELNYNRFNHNLDQNESIYYEASMTGIFYNDILDLTTSLMTIVSEILFGYKV